MQVLVRDNNVDQALRVLKKKMQREGVFREMKARKDYEKPSERKAREKAEAVCRARKQARKTAIREGLIAAPKPKPRFGGGPRRPGMSSGSGLRPQTCSGVGFSTDEKPAPEEQSERGREGY